MLKSIGAIVFLAVLSGGYVSFGLEIYFPQRALTPGKTLTRTIERQPEAVVEVVVRDATQFEVTRSHFGTLTAGQRLEFDNLRGLGKRRSEDRVGRLVRDTPILTTVLDENARVYLPRVAGLDELPRAAPDAHFLLVLDRLGDDGSWRLSREAFGSLFLFQDNQTYYFAPGRLDGRAVEFWLPFGPATFYQEFVTRLSSELQRIDGGSTAG